MGAIPANASALAFAVIHFLFVKFVGPIFDEALVGFFADGCHLVSLSKGSFYYCVKLFPDILPVPAKGGIALRLRDIFSVEN
jgi:hypothetical protein